MRLDDMAHVPKVDAKTFMIYCGLTREGFVIISKIIWNEICDSRNGSRFGDKDKSATFLTTHL